ncbi:MAG TPA: thiamine phosphate synthase [Pyrinomonadaceae bacterium]|nr:thiamine phosphate synthase [Pyrinomonadaceae bacterium]
MSPFTLPKLYPLTDARLSGLSHAEQVARLAEGGASLVQLREKRLAPREFYREAAAALKVARARGVQLVINDRADIALALGADGVHLGQDDLAPEAARALLGGGAVVGYSTHSVEQAVGAARLPVSYVAIGPVFLTSSKENPDPVVGLEGVRRVRAAAGRLPLVAIGGITRENARAVLEAGADSVAVIGDLLKPGDPAEITRLTRAFLDRLEARPER